MDTDQEGTANMPDMEFRNAVAAICAKDKRYPADAYLFTREALDYTTKMLAKTDTNRKKHVTGVELLDGNREFTLQEFGPIALTVLKSWGIVKTEDFGEIVFNLVESGVLGKTDTDKKEDFAGGYDFFTTFAKPYIPAAAVSELKKKSRAATSKRRGTKS